MYHSILSVLICLTTFPIFSSETDFHNPYFSTKVLANAEKMRAILINDGFTPCTFHTQDGIKIAGLFLRRADAQYTVICASGWFPGQKEGIATLYKLLPDNCNILFFDARGHGKSKGSFLYSLCTYGTTEYQDIIAAIKFIIQTVEQRSIILWGTCAGSFHMLHALNKLTIQKDPLLHYIKGLICDSSWSSVRDVTYSVPNGEIVALSPKIAATGYQWLFSTLRAEKFSHNSHKDFISNIFTKTFQMIHNVLYYPIIYPLFSWNENSTCLIGKLRHIQQPIFFIHATNDIHAPIEKAKKLASELQNKDFWEISHSKHACHILKHAQEYKNRMQQFIENVLADKKLSTST